MTPIALLLPLLGAQDPAPAPDAAATSTERLNVPVPGGATNLELLRCPAGALPDGTETEGFWLGATELTWDAFEAWVYALDHPPEQRTNGKYAESRPSKPYGAPDRGWGRQGYAALGMTPHAAERFCEWLTAESGHRFRLPTEAEWEYACRAGDDPLGPGVDAVAWHLGNARDRAHAVATRAPNAWGFHDLLGNVGEWCVAPPADDASLDDSPEDATPEGNAPAHVLRGGHFLDRPEDLTPDRAEVPRASWNATDPQQPKSAWWLADAPFVGFRVLCEGPVEETDERPAPPQDDPDPEDAR